MVAFLIRDPAKAIEASIIEHSSSKTATNDYNP